MNMDADTAEYVHAVTDAITNDTITIDPDTVGIWYPTWMDRDGNPSTHVPAHPFPCNDVACDEM